MLIASFPAGPWQANCYLLSHREGGHCVVVDPGVEAADGVRQGLAQYGLRLSGVLLTHGHADHVASAREIADDAGVPVWIHEADADLLAHPMLAMSEQARPVLEQMCGGTEFALPADVRHYDDSFELAGIRFATSHAPGHTPGCTLLRPELDDAQLVFTGDVLFSGSIGRTDLPRGDAFTMASSLVTAVLPLDDACHLLPGHGPTTTMAHERRNNPYLQPEQLYLLQNPQGHHDPDDQNGSI